MADERIVIELDLETGEVVKQFKKVESKAADAGRGAGKSFSRGFKKSLDRINVSLGKSLKNSLLAPIRLIKSEFLALGAAVAGGFIFKKAIDESSKLQNALIGVNSVGNAFGISTDRINNAVQSLAADGLIPLEDVTDSLKNLIVNFDGDLQKSVETFKALSNAAAFNRQGTLSLGQAIKGASEGLKNDLSIKVDNAGVTKNLSILQKEYAAQIGTSVGKLTEAQKAQAEYLGVLRESSIFQGDYNKLTQTFSGAVTKLQTSFKFLLVAVGDFVTQSPAVLVLLNTITQEIVKLTKTLNDAGTGGFKSFVLGSIKVGQAINDYIIKPLSFIGDATNEAFNFFVAFGSGVVAIIGQIGGKLGGLLEKLGVFDSLAEKLNTFAESSKEVFVQALTEFGQGTEAAFGFETTEKIDEFFNNLKTNIEATGPQIVAFGNKLGETGEEVEDLADKGKQAAKAINDSIGKALTKTASLGIQALTKSLLLGQQGFEGFGKAVAGILGSMAIQLGETLIFTGLGIEALKTLGGAAAIAAGVGLIALGTILKSFSGGGGAGAGGVGGGGGITTGASTGDEAAIAQVEEEEREAPGTEVSVVIQGDVLDSQETGTRLVGIINDAFEKDGVVIKGASFA